MRSRWQKTGTNECGAVCVAMLTGVETAEARRWLYGDKKGGRVGRTRIVEAIVANTALRPVSDRPQRLSRQLSLRDLKHSALVYAEALTIEEGEVVTESKHWVVWDYRAQTIRDPLGFSHPLRLTSATEFA